MLPGTECSPRHVTTPPRWSTSAYCWQVVTGQPPTEDAGPSDAQRFWVLLPDRSMDAWGVNEPARYEIRADGVLVVLEAEARPGAPARKVLRSYPAEEWLEITSSTPATRRVEQAERALGVEAAARESSFGQGVLLFMALVVQVSGALWAASALDVPSSRLTVIAALVPFGFTFVVLTSLQERHDAEPGLAKSALLWIVSLICTIPVTAVALWVVNLIGFEYRPS